MNISIKQTIAESVKRGRGRLNEKEERYKQMGDEILRVYLRMT